MPTTPVATPAPKRIVKPKPEKPRDNFPLYWHPRGYWMCKRDGEEWIYEADADASYDRYVIDMNNRAKGVVAQVAPKKRYSLRDAINLYLTRQKRLWEDGKLSDVQFLKCRRELEAELPKAIKLNTPLSALRALAPDDAGPGDLFRKIYTRAKARGPSALHRHVILVRAMLDFADSKKLMLAPDYGDDFTPPTQNALDEARHAADAEHGSRAWSVEELRKIVAGAKGMKRNPHLYAQILLGLFAAFGSDDCSALSVANLDRELGIVKGVRAKNKRPRVAVLPKIVWDALDASRKKLADAAGDDAKHLVFRSESGLRCNAAVRMMDAKGLSGRTRNDTIGKNFIRLTDRLGVKRFRAGFKTLRAMSRSLMVGSGVDNDLISVVMGRRFNHPIDEYYLRGELREKLADVSRHIEAQLFPVKRTVQLQATKRGANAKPAWARAKEKPKSRNREARR